MKIKEFREKRGMTTIELGKELGVVPSTVTNWESGIRNPSIPMLIKLAETFECSVDALLGIEKAKKERDAG